LFGVIHIWCSQEAKNLAYLSLVRPHLEYAAAAWDPYMAKRVQRCAARFVKKDYRYTQLLSLVCLTNLVGCPCSNVVNTHLTVFHKGLNNLSAFLWITSQFHHGILEPPTKINLCHCQFVLMSSNIHFFLGPLLIGIPTHLLFVSCSRLSPSMGLCRTWHPPTVADYHDTPAVTGGLHSLLDIAPKNRRMVKPKNWPDPGM